MPYCPNCGAQYKEVANFCPECGEPIEREEAKQEGKPAKRGVSFWVKLGVFVMVVGFFIGWIGFQIGNQGVGFGGIKTLVVGLIIFIIAKWRDKKAFIVSGGIIVGWVLFSLLSSAWQNRSVEIKKIIGEKCKFCEKVISAETTTVEKAYKEVKGKDFIYAYKSIICDSCADVGKRIHREAQEEYARGNYILARNKFLFAQKRGIQNADTWVEKAQEKIREEEKKQKAKAQAKKTQAQAEMQAKRAQFIQKLKEGGAIYKIEKWADFYHVYVGAVFYTGSIDEKESIVNVIWAYYKTKDPGADIIVLHDWSTGKKIGTYGKYGLDLY